MSRLVERIESYALQYGYRRLRLQPSGRWYVTLVIFLGAAAIASTNNILYLLESFLLGGLLLSGILSEYAVASIQLKWIRGSAIAGSKPSDDLWIINHGRIPVLCIEIGEWSGQEFHSLGFSAFVPAKSQIKVQVLSTYSKRGRHSWAGMAVQTSYPFGFASKLRWIDSPGSRMIWPSPLGSPNPSQGRSVESGRGAADWIDGEVRPASPNDDLRGAIWRLAIRGGDTLVRPRGCERSELLMELNLERYRSDPAEFETEISRIASLLYGLADDTRAELLIRDADQIERIEGKQWVLDRLAVLDCHSKSQGTAK